MLRLYVVDDECAKILHGKLRKWQAIAAKWQGQSHETAVRLMAGTTLPWSRLPLIDLISITYLVYSCRILSTNQSSRLARFVVFVTCHSALWV